MDIRFLADRNLGTLVKWLRILGYDTSYDRGNTSRDFIHKAATEGRIILTRKRDFAGRRLPTRLVVVKADKAPNQLAEVLATLAIIPDPLKRMTLCIRCNAFLDEIPKETAYGFVPTYVYQKYGHFRRCSSCARVFWPGTHRERIEEHLKAQFAYRALLP